MVNSNDGMINVDKLMDIAQINPLYEMEIDLLSSYNVDYNSFIFLPIFLSLILLIYVVKSFFVSTSKPSTVSRKLTNIAVMAMAFIMSLLPIPSLLQDLDVKDYHTYMTKVEVNIINSIDNLNNKEKEILSFCLRDGAQITSKNGLPYFKNHYNSGERFDKCIIRFAMHQKNEFMNSEFKNTDIEKSEKLSQNIDKIRKDKLNTPLNNFNEGFDDLKSSIATTAEIMLDGKAKELAQNIVSEVKDTAKTIINSQINNMVTPEKASDIQSENTNSAIPVKAIVNGAKDLATEVLKKGIEHDRQHTKNKLNSENDSGDTQVKDKNKLNSEPSNGSESEQIK